MTRQKRPKTELSKAPVVYPSGVCVKTDKGCYYINGEVRLVITSDRVYRSWSFPITAVATEESLSKYPKLGKLGFRDGTLLRNTVDARLYMVAKSKLRPVLSPDVLTRLNINYSDAILVSQEEINLHAEGEPLT